MFGQGIIIVTKRIDCFFIKNIFCTAILINIDGNLLYACELYFIYFVRRISYTAFLIASPSCGDGINRGLSRYTIFVGVISKSRIPSDTCYGTTVDCSRCGWVRTGDIAGNSFHIIIADGCNATPFDTTHNTTSINSTWSCVCTRDGSGIHFTPTNCSKSLIVDPSHDTSCVRKAALCCIV